MKPRSQQLCRASLVRLTDALLVERVAAPSSPVPLLQRFRVLRCGLCSPAFVTGEGDKADLQLTEYKEHGGSGWITQP